MKPLRIFLVITLLVSQTVLVVAREPVRARRGMVASTNEVASRVGVEIMKRGGNAVDAAIAVAFALAVTHPAAGNLGGGGFMMIRLNDGRTTAIDYREMAPAAITRDSFLDDGGNADPQKSLASGLGVGVPGTVAGLALAHRKYGSGKFTLAQLIAPAIALARDGFVVTGDLADTFASAKPLFQRWPSSAKVMLKPDGTSYGEGDRLVQTDLANTLEAIAKNGPQAFYEGEIAAKIAADAKKLGGVLTADDLKGYKVRVAPAVEVPWRARTVQLTGALTAAPTAADVLRQMSSARIGKAPDAEWYVALARALKSAYARRLTSLGDAEPQAAESCTTHLTVCDGDGTMVAVTGGLFEPTGLPPELAAQSSRVVGAFVEVGPLDLSALSEEAGTWGPGLVAQLLGCTAPSDDEPVPCDTAEKLAASPISYVTPDDPPMYLGYGSMDGLVPPDTNAYELAHAYTRAGVGQRVAVDEVSDLGHNLDIDGVNVTHLGVFLDGIRDHPQE